MALAEKIEEPQWRSYDRCREQMFSIKRYGVRQALSSTKNSLSLTAQTVCGQPCRFNAWPKGFSQGAVGLVTKQTNEVREWLQQSLSLAAARPVRQCKAWKGRCVLRHRIGRKCQEGSLRGEESRGMETLPPNVVH